MMRPQLTFACAALVLSFAPAAKAFCGFYVAPTDKPLANEATRVALMRDGTRTALSMSTDYHGPLEDFAMVVPVPVVLQKESVKTLPLDLFDRLETLTAPRLVEYWEQDPCGPAGWDGIGLGTVGGFGKGAGTGMGYGGGGHVTVHAQFTVGEYEIVILGADESDALESWLRDHHYTIPKGASAALAPYVKAQQKFFVAKVDSKKVKRDKDGAVTLSPLRFHYESSDFRLPVRLGLLNAKGRQDLVVFVLGHSRFHAANFPNAFVPTNLDVAEETRASFHAFYARLFDATIEKNAGKAVVTEYAWGPQSCDPCPGPTLTDDDIATLGGDVMTALNRQLKMIESGTDIGEGIAPEVVKRIVRGNFPRFRACYGAALAKNPGLAGTISTQFVIAKDGTATEVKSEKGTLDDPTMNTCVASIFKSLSFPEVGAPVRVTYPIDFQTDIGGFGGGDLTLTRLHARYDATTLTDDLVFEAAGPIVGGRETYALDGTLEKGAKPAEGVSSFQSRYVIRHPWTGPIACKEPHRNNWGGPPQGTKKETVAATGLASAPRDVKLASLVKGGLDGIDGWDSAASQFEQRDVQPKKQATRYVRSSRRSCHCNVAGADANSPGFLGAGMLGVVALTRRLTNRRRRSRHLHR
ncbi:MAG: DUF2330 domain-containing protein [Polyangiales bacterium]